MCPKSAARDFDWLNAYQHALLLRAESTALTKGLQVLRQTY